MYFLRLKESGFNSIYRLKVIAWMIKRCSGFYFFRSEIISSSFVSISGGEIAGMQILRMPQMAQENVSGSTASSL